MSFARSLPVIVSILTILTVAFLRERSRTLAVIFGTMPINLPLTLWITFGGATDSVATIAAFVRSLVLGLLATFLWLAVVWLVVRIGWGLLAAVASAYAVWGVLIAVFLAFGVLSINR
ncbi:MAG: hypothetical protein NT075_35470 [Chloroflexi bacterium]|nr:hypothetical protein [Chloroflexota bacterium]